MLEKEKQKEKDEEKEKETDTEKEKEKENIQQISGVCDPDQFAFQDLAAVSRMLMDLLRFSREFW